MIPELVLTMTLSIYVPQAGGINGGKIMADGNVVRMGAVACGPRYPFGTVFEILLDELPQTMPPSIPHVLECRDRGSYVGNRNLDILLMTHNVHRDLWHARRWGKRKLSVRVWKNWQAYHAAVMPI
jgi:hypothetical protein